jgi:hypothetical protein
MVFARSATRSLHRPISSLLAGQAATARRTATPSVAGFAKRTLTASAARQGKVLLVLYDVSTLSRPRWSMSMD